MARNHAMTRFQLAKFWLTTFPSEFCDSCWSAEALFFVLTAILTAIRDPRAFLHAAASAVALAPDTDLLEYVCNENESRRRAVSGPTDEQKRVVVPAQTLSRYAGRYVVAGPAAGIPFKTLDVRLENGNSCWISTTEEVFRWYRNQQRGLGHDFSSLSSDQMNTEG